MSKTVKVPFLAQATAVREIEVTIPDDTPDDKVVAVATERAVDAMNQNEDPYNAMGVWTVNAVDAATIMLDPKERVMAPAPDKTSLEDATGIVPGA